MAASPLLQRYLDEQRARVPLWMGRVAREAQHALRASTPSVALRDLAGRPLAEADAALRERQATWAKAVAERLAGTWRSELAGTTPEPAPAGGGRAAWSAQALTLVDEDAADQNIELLRATQEVEVLLENHVHDLQARSATLRGDSVVGRHANLLRPQLVVQAVWDASESLGLDAPARKALMRAASGPLGRALQQVSIDAERQLADWGVAAAAWQASALASPRRLPAPSSGVDLTRPGALDELRGRLSGRVAPPPAAPDTLLKLDLGLAQALDPVTPGVPAAPPPRLMDRLPDLAPMARNDDDREVMLLVAHMFDAILDDALLAPSVRQMLGLLQGPLLRIAIREPRLLEDHSHPSWQLMVRLATHTAGFQDDHDARLVALLAEVRRLFEALQAAPRPDATQHAAALSALDGLLVSELDAERRDAAEPIAKLQAAARRTAVNEALRGQVRLQIQEAAGHWRIEGGAPPAPGDAVTLDPELHDFLVGPWVDMLAQVALQDGEHADSTRSLRAVVPDLLVSLAPLRSDGDRRRLLASVPGLVQRLQQGMARANLPAARREALLAVLMARHTELLRLEGATPAAREPSAEEIVRRLRDEDLPPPHVVAPASGDSMFDIGTLETVPAALMPDTPAVDGRAWLRHLAVGQWCRLVARGSWSTARVLWVDGAREHWLFSDAELGVTHGLTRRALERLAQGGLAAPVEERTLIERAVDSLLASPGR